MRRRGWATLSSGVDDDALGLQSSLVHSQQEALAMLVLSRRAQQQISFPNLGVTLSILQVLGKVVKVGIDAPPSEPTFRSWDRWFDKPIDMAGSVQAINEDYASIRAEVTGQERQGVVPCHFS